MPTKVCKLCFKDIKNTSIIGFLNPNLSLCSQCYHRLMPRFIHFYVLGFEAMSFYYYDQDIRALLYQFKGCFDYEIAGIFLERYFRETRLKYLGYIVVPIPSFEEDNERRGFNHVIEIFKLLKLPIKNVLVKTSYFKQANHNKKERKNINKHMAINEKQNLTNQKVLIVDDVYTTGSTMKAAIRLIKTLHPKDIKVLVMSKTRNDHHYN